MSGADAPTPDQGHANHSQPLVRPDVGGRSLSGPSANIKDESGGRTTSSLRPPGQVPVILKELMNDGKMWRENADWIKIEEEEKGAEPHVASVHSLLSNGAVLLDLQQRTLAGIVQQVAAQMEESGQIRTQDRDRVQRTLLLPHSLVSDETAQIWSVSTLDLNNQSGSSEPAPGHRGAEPEVRPDLPETGPEEAPPPSLSTTNQEAALLQKVPEGTEATVVLTGSVDFLSRPCVAFVRLQEAVVLRRVLEVPVPVRFLLVLLGPISCSTSCEQGGRSLCRLMSDRNFLQAATRAEDRQQLLSAARHFLEPPPEGDAHKPPRCDSVKWREEEVSADHQQEATSPGSVLDPSLRRSGRLFGGLIRDVRRRYPQYVGDITDALNPQCLAAVVFIYFAALSPAITFGGLLGEKTEGLMGVSELIVATAMQGLVFSLLGAQPLLVIGFSGPLLVFEDAFFSFCRVHGVDYLTGRLWIGVWLLLIVVVTVAMEGSVLVALVSRFTQEIFSFLISLIFIYETFSKLLRIFQEHPLQTCFHGNATTPPPLLCNSTSHCENPELPEAPGNPEGEPNTALFSLVLMMGTFSIAFYLRAFKDSSFFPGTLRRIIGDFGVPIAMALMVLVDQSVDHTYTQKLSVPSGFSVSSPEKRGWLISPLGSDGQFPVWMMCASVLPAVLVFILLFMESQITALIVSKKERKLVKGTGFHLDLLIIVAVGGVSALFGLPWLSAATVRSVTHTNALTVMSKPAAPGDPPRIQEVKEQRVTGFLVALLVGLSIVMGTVLRQIPLAVLFGIFLYMGVMSLRGIQLTDRLVLLMMPAKYHPHQDYVRQVKTFRMHLYTLVQLTCLSLLWVVMATAASLAFPFLLLLTIPVRRFLLPHLFTHLELESLDGDEVQRPLEEQDQCSELQVPV